MENIDFEKRGYKVPDNYFADFPTTLPLREKRKIWIDNKLAIASLLVILITLSTFLFFYQSKASAEPELTFEEQLYYDASYDFEDELASIIQDNDVEIDFFDGIDESVLQEYLDYDFPDEDI